VWIAAVNLPSHTDVAYKYIVLDKAGQVVEWCEEAAEPGGGNLQVGLGQAGCQQPCLAAGSISGCWPDK
jgi:hypothetical protein